VDQKSNERLTPNQAPHRIAHPGGFANGGCKRAPGMRNN